MSLEHVNFLLARLGEQRLGYQHMNDTVRLARSTTTTGGVVTTGYEVVLHRDKLIAECDANIGNVKWARYHINLSNRTPDDGAPSSERIHGIAYFAEIMLDQLVLPYSDHPDFNKEWRIESE